MKNYSSNVLQFFIVSLLSCKLWSQDDNQYQDYYGSVGDFEFSLSFDYQPPIEPQSAVQESQDYTDSTSSSSQASNFDQEAYYEYCRERALDNYADRLAQQQEGMYHLNYTNHDEYVATEEYYNQDSSLTVYSACKSLKEFVFGKSKKTIRKEQEQARIAQKYCSISQTSSSLPT